MNRFAWLLRREWMQHHRGWLILAVVPLVLTLLLLPFSTINFEGKDTVKPTVVALVAATGYSYVMAMIVAASVLFQAGGMARRDQQDRSIEFWLSLPTSHSQSLLATLLMHVLVMPLMVLTISFLGGQLVAIGVVVKLAGVPALASVFDASWFGYQALAYGRMVLGLVVAALWLSAVLLGAMASAAWLKGWGVPAVAAVTGIASLLMQELAGNPVLGHTIAMWFRQASVALMPLVRGEGTLKAVMKDAPGFAGLRDWLATETTQLLRDLAAPQLAAALLIATLAFGLLVLRRAGGFPLPALPLRRAA